MDMSIYNRPFDNQLQVRIRLETIAIYSILQRIKKGDFTLLWSFMIDYENSLNPYDDIRIEIEMASSLAKERVSPDESIVAAANQFKAKDIKPRDALHLACASAGKAEYFITCDDKLIKKTSDLEANFYIMNPISFVENMEVN